MSFYFKWHAMRYSNHISTVRLDIDLKIEMDSGPSSQWLNKARTHFLSLKRNLFHSFQEYGNFIHICVAFWDSNTWLLKKTPTNRKDHPALKVTVRLSYLNKKQISSISNLNTKSYVLTAWNTASVSIFYCWHIFPVFK